MKGKVNGKGVRQQIALSPFLKVEVRLSTSLIFSFTQQCDLKEALGGVVFLLSHIVYY